MRQAALLAGIAASAAWLWLMRRAGLLGMSPGELAASSALRAVLVLVLPLSGAIMAATLAVSRARGRAPAASSALKVLSVAGACVGAGLAADVVAHGGPGPAALFLVTGSVPLGVVFALRSPHRVSWPPHVIAMIGVLGALAATWSITTSREVEKERAQQERAQRQDHKKVRRPRDEPLCY